MITIQKLIQNLLQCRDAGLVLPKNNDNEDNVFYTNSSRDPRLGSWTTRNISDITGPIFGVRSDYYYSVEGVAGKTVQFKVEVAEIREKKWPILTF
mgnify:CR=1 FL=1